LVVLDAAGEVFCGGIDIGEYTSQRVFQVLDAFHGVFTAMLEMGKPVLVIVNGQPSAAARSCGIRRPVIATPRARFAQPEITIGVFPPLASTILPYLVGRSWRSNWCHRRGDHRRASQRAGPGEPPGAGKRSSRQR